MPLASTTLDRERIFTPGWHEGPSAPFARRTADCSGGRSPRSARHEGERPRTQEATGRWSSLVGLPALTQRGAVETASRGRLTSETVEPLETLVASWATGGSSRHSVSAVHAKSRPPLVEERVAGCGPDPGSRQRLIAAALTPTLRLRWLSCSRGARERCFPPRSGRGPSVATAFGVAVTVVSWRPCGCRCGPYAWRRPRGPPPVSGDPLSELGAAASCCSPCPVCSVPDTMRLATRRLGCLRAVEPAGVEGGAFRNTSTLVG